MTLLLLTPVVLAVVALAVVGFLLVKGSEKDYQLEQYTYYDPGLGRDCAFAPPTAAPTKTLSVVVPSYNEEERISVMLDETIGYLKSRAEQEKAFDWEIVIVDDGSKDRTTPLALEYVERVGTDFIRVLTLKQNVGKGGAVRRGMLVARGEYLLMADADGATRFSDVETLEATLKRVQRGKKGLVCGSRSQYHPELAGESEKRPWYRDVSHIVFLLLVNTLCVRDVLDTQCGFKLFTRATALELFLFMHIERWAFDVDLLYLAQAKGHPIGEAVVRWVEVDGSHLSVVGASLQMFKDVLRVPLLYGIGFWKMK
mmetsp:Transcript_160/g.554  ORF Transcript_160/g.554 Transcript_160/m.554 type:complete len:313 (+) Transcript_160:123-1061(+)